MHERYPNLRTDCLVMQENKRQENLNYQKKDKNISIKVRNIINVKKMCDEDKNVI